MCVYGNWQICLFITIFSLPVKSKNKCSTCPGPSATDFHRQVANALTVKAVTSQPLSSVQIISKKIISVYTIQITYMSHYSLQNQQVMSSVMCTVRTYTYLLITFLGQLTSS